MQKDWNRYEQRYKASIIDMETYKLLPHKEWNNIEHGHKDINTTAISTYPLLEHKKSTGMSLDPRQWTPQILSNLHPVSTPEMKWAWM